MWKVAEVLHLRQRLLCDQGAVQVLDFFNVDLVASQVLSLVTGRTPSTHVGLIRLEAEVKLTTGICSLLNQEWCSTECPSAPSAIRSILLAC